VGALIHHESALRASLQAEYQLRLLPGGRTEPERTPRELGDYIAHLPHGCALWIDTGGVPALSAEAHLLREAVYRLEVLDWHTGGSNGPQPKRIELPEPAHEARARQAVLAEKARKHAARDRRRSQPTT